ncbi:hypothetical protein PULV_a6004 [Pseudoalteromonas ulvae UL12]|nr:hypothetical protein [Pseudoalteromonas ulvae UL12]
MIIVKLIRRIEFTPPDQIYPLINKFFGPFH